MQITRIEVEIGVTINAGDFQCVKATTKVCADLDRTEDPVEAHAKLTSFVRQSLVDGAKASHPEQVKRLLIGEARMVEADKSTSKANGAAEPVAEKKKPGRPKKEAEAPKLADTSGMDIGGLDKEDELDGLGDEGDEDELSSALSALLGDTDGEETVTREDVQAVLVKFSKKHGKPMLLELLKKHGASSLQQLPENKFAIVKKDAEKLLG